MQSACTHLPLEAVDLDAHSRLIDGGDDEIDIWEVGVAAEHLARSGDRRRSGRDQEEIGKRSGGDQEAVMR